MRIFFKLQAFTAFFDTFGLQPKVLTFGLQPKVLTFGLTFGLQPKVFTFGLQPKVIKWLAACMLQAISKSTFS